MPLATEIAVEAGLGVSEWRSCLPNAVERILTDPRRLRQREGGKSEEHERLQEARSLAAAVQEGEDPAEVLSDVRLHLDEWLRDLHRSHPTEGGEK